MPLPPILFIAIQLDPGRPFTSGRPGDDPGCSSTRNYVRYYVLECYVSRPKIVSLPITHRKPLRLTSFVSITLLFLVVKRIRLISSVRWVPQMIRVRRGWTIFIKLMRRLIIFVLPVIMLNKRLTFTRGGRLNVSRRSLTLFRPRWVARFSKKENFHRGGRWNRTRLRGCSMLIARKIRRNRRRMVIKRLLLRLLILRKILLSFVVIVMRWFGLMRLMVVMSVAFIVRRLARVVLSNSVYWR